MSFQYVNTVLKITKGQIILSLKAVKKKVITFVTFKSLKSHCFKKSQTTIIIMEQI